jgi:hypothetical protein
MIEGERPVSDISVSFMSDENKFTSHQYHLGKSDTRMTLGQPVTL